jgi:murein DD-endopeptidase MepM/ murein hydrolase activator NlpD
MSERAVSVGDWVDSGDTIGYVGMTGSAYGYHLHFEVRQDNAVQNPRDYMYFKPYME